MDDGTPYKRGDIITHPIAGRDWLHIVEVKRNDYGGYVCECINQRTGSKVSLLAYDTLLPDNAGSIKLISKMKGEQ